MAYITKHEFDYLMSLTLDFETLDWDEVHEYFIELSKKYNFDPKQSTINSNTGEIVIRKK